MNPKIRIAVVTEDQGLAGSLEIRLQSRGYQALPFVGMSSVIGFIYSDPPDIVIIDCSSRSGAAESVIRNLKSDSYFSTIPVIGLINGSTSDSFDWNDCQLDDFIFTHIHYPELFCRVNLSLQRIQRIFDNNPLTRLPGNTSIQRAVDAALGEPKAVCYIDINHFKPYNDTYGFSHGDEVLRMLARIMFNAVKESGGSAGRAAELVNGLLAFSRKQVIHPKPVDLCEVLHGLKKMLGRIIREDIDFRTNVFAKELVVMADKGQIEQALMNFVTNAKDAMPHGGTLSIDVSPVFMDSGFVHAHGFGEPGYYACISVADSGCGMDEETQKKIFEPFYTTKEVGKGTGLGMAIIYGIVKQHNGYIDVYSEPGIGTTFRVYLPLLAEKRNDEQNAPLAEPPKGGNETVLLVEDDVMVRELHGTILEQAGYTIIEAIDGEDALAKFMKHHHKVDILVTDVIMPKIDGKRLLMEIQELRPEIKVLFISGYTKDIVIERGILDDESIFISKPVMTSDLLKKMRNILDRDK